MDIVNKFENHGDIELNVPLSKYTTYKIGGEAKGLIHPKNEMSLLRILEICKQENEPVKVLGKGSNILCSDEYFNGIIIHLGRYFNEFVFEENGLCYAQAGVSLVQLANQAMKHSYSGLEFASGIPGSVGGAVKMNAGAYKKSLSDIIQRVYVIKDDECVWLNKKELAFAYRHSIFHEQPQWVVLGVELQLAPGDQKEIADLMSARRQRRKDSQPLDKPSAGSVFTNPEETPVWQLIDGCGLRGMRIGGAKISEKHVNFIVNENHATAQDVADLVELVQTKVYEKYGVHLRMEVEKFNWDVKKQPQ